MRPIDYFDRGVRKTPDRDFLVSENVKYSYKQAAELIDNIAKGLYAAGFEFEGRRRLDPCQCKK